MSVQNEQRPTGRDGEAHIAPDNTNRSRANSCSNNNKSVTKKSITKGNDKIPAGSVATYVRKIRRYIERRGEQPTAQQAQPNCGGCSKCCDGVFDLNLFLPEEEIRLNTLAAERGLGKLCEGGVMKLHGKPCPFLDTESGKGGCTIYNARPDVCQGYDCRVLALLPPAVHLPLMQVHAVRRWAFQFKTLDDYIVLEAVRQTAIAIREQLAHRQEELLDLHMLAFQAIINHDAYLPQAREMLKNHALDSNMLQVLRFAGANQTTVYEVLGVRRAYWLADALLQSTLEKAIAVPYERSRQEMEQELQLAEQGVAFARRLLDMLGLPHTPEGIMSSQANPAVMHALRGAATAAGR